MISISEMTSEELTAIKQKIESVNGDVSAQFESAPGSILTLLLAIRCFRRVTHGSPIVGAMVEQMEDCEISLRESLMGCLDEIGVSRIDQERFIATLMRDAERGFDRAMITPRCDQPRPVTNSAELMQLLPTVSVPLVLDGLSMLRLGAAVWEYPAGSIVADQGHVWQPFFQYLQHTLGVTGEVFDETTEFAMGDDSAEDSA